MSSQSKTVLYFSLRTLEWASMVQHVRKALRMWLDTCCGALLKLANLSDNAYLLRHLTYLPGVGKRRHWAISYLQFPQSVTMPDGTSKRYGNDSKGRCKRGYRK